MKKISLALIAVTTVLMVGYQNCAKPVAFTQDSLNNGSGDPDDPVVPDTPDDPHRPDDPDVIETCAGSGLKTKVVDLSFPTRVGCEWDSNGNLGYSDVHIQARSEEAKSIVLPTNSVLCNMEFDFAEQNSFKYDDHIFLTLNNRILMTTAADVFDREYLDSDSSGFIYNWSKLVGKVQDVGGTNVYCNGVTQESDCELPPTNSTTGGKFSINIPKSTIQEIMVNTGKTTHELKLITTGDNDPDSDCGHDGVSVRVTITYHD